MCFRLIRSILNAPTTQIINALSQLSKRHQEQDVRCTASCIGGPWTALDHILVTQRRFSAAACPEIILRTENTFFLRPGIGDILSCHSLSQGESCELNLITVRRRVGELVVAAKGKWVLLNVTSSLSAFVLLFSKNFTIFIDLSSPDASLTAASVNDIPFKASSPTVFHMYFSRSSFGSVFSRATGSLSYASMALLRNRAPSARMTQMRPKTHHICRMRLVPYTQEPHHGEHDLCNALPGH